MDLRMHTLVLQDLVKLMLDRVVEEHGGTVRWKHKVVGVGQDGEKAWVECETPEGRKRVEGGYIVGCDGANSAVRRGLFGEEFPGFTWDAQIIATNVSICWKTKLTITPLRRDNLDERLTDPDVLRLCQVWLA